ncbi:zinc-binding dehydrogenase [Cobetia crustatorum]|uniref:zinc-binding dehydrogenase n=1 Tax=Cobetia crustatorum TaxID=553385 RepID=UPI001C957D44|nr:zinc-binding dehydrogenase [Cobetia crustatorum]
MQSLPDRAPTVCKNIIAVDLHESRLTLARELGATHSVNGKTQDLVGEIKRIIDGGSEFSLETTGVPMLVRHSLQALRRMPIASWLSRSFLPEQANRDSTTQHGALVAPCCVSFIVIWPCRQGSASAR